MRVSPKLAGQRPLTCERFVKPEKGKKHNAFLGEQRSALRDLIEEILVNGYSECIRQKKP